MRVNVTWWRLNRRLNACESWCWHGNTRVAKGDSAACATFLKRYDTVDELLPQAMFTTTGTIFEMRLCGAITRIWE